ncbi:DUF2459 domain-containing protein [Planktotalea sp.]|uniref:DUF2459 domain-containing protein n=1 Tax=Planktotalea sp. TaxID=2029877 RepID=UPI0032990F10
MRLIKLALWLGSRALLTLCFVSSLYFVAALLGAVHVGKQSPEHNSSRKVQIGLLQGPIHYDLLLPLSPTTNEHFDWLKRAGLALDHPQAEWMIVGWGAREFYTSTGTYKDVSSKSILRAITGDQSVMRVDIAGPVTKDAPLRWVSLSDADYQKLLASVTGSFVDGDTTHPLHIDGFNAYDMFFPAKGRFHVFQTCNVWIGKMMRAADVPFGRWTPIPLSVTLSLRLGAN